MAMRRDAPEPWASAMIQAGATDPRNKNRPSMRALAEIAGVDTSTVTGLIFGDRETELQVIEQVAEALGADVVIVAEWAGRPRALTEPYVPPKEADMLNRRQRKALDELIRSFAESEFLMKGKDDIHEPGTNSQKKTDRPAVLSGQTVPLRPRRARTPSEIAFESYNGVAARPDTEA